MLQNVTVVANGKSIWARLNKKISLSSRHVALHLTTSKWIIPYQTNLTKTEIRPICRAKDSGTKARLGRNIYHTQIDVNYYVYITRLMTLVSQQWPGEDNARPKSSTGDRSQFIKWKQNKDHSHLQYDISELLFLCWT